MFTFKLKTLLNILLKDLYECIAKLYYFSCTRIIV